MELNQLLLSGVRNKASDVHLTVDTPPLLRIDGELRTMNLDTLTHDDMENYAKDLLNPEQLAEFNLTNDLDIAHSVEGNRFRVNVYRQQGNIAIAFRIINSVLPTMESIGLPEMFKEMIQKKKGLILVTGPTGSGKSTTLAAMINYINNTTSRHIITLEDPIEYLYPNAKSIINQREVGKDTDSFNIGLRAALRQDPDVILVGEMRDADTVATAVTAAETGHLVLSTLHTNGAANTINRIIDVFEPHQQQQIRSQLASVIEGVISQQLLPLATGSGRMAVFEIMTGTSAIRNLIREDKTYQITSSMQTGVRFGMQTMKMAVDKLTATGKVTQLEANRILAMFD